MPQNSTITDYFSKSNGHTTKTNDTGRVATTITTRIEKRNIDRPEKRPFNRIVSKSNQYFPLII